MAAAAFWIFLAAIIVAATWKHSQSEKVKHETVRFLIEKNQKLDEGQISELLNPKPPQWLYPQQKPGYAYRGLRAFGIIILFVALGLALVGIWRGLLFGLYDHGVQAMAAAIPFWRRLV